MTLKTILIGLGVGVVTGSAFLGGGNAIKEEVETKKAADAFEKRSKERHAGYDVSIKDRKFGSPKIKIRRVILDGNNNIVENGGEGK